MARLPRYALVGQPQHVIQRGNNRSRAFAAEADYQFFLDCTAVACDRYGCELHAYVLMTNHVHLLMTPLQGGAIGTVMQAVGRRYVPYFNRKYGRTGTLWDNRYRATVVDSERYLLTCYRYIELNPVRAGMVATPAEYRWSSHRANARGLFDPIVTPHETYLALAADADCRRSAYQALTASALDAATLCEIRDATNNAWALGDDRFCEGLSLRQARRSRPLRIRKRQPQTSDP